ncbi:hypothetical protein SLS62_006524 [Diatrype stigma]|uniref:Uncharacterized protein n=1 Tax=Diatrype stigma TaxID=117547 RepID=A0AAN9UYH4_9PEZI
MAQMPPNPSIHITGTPEPEGMTCLTCLRPLSDHRLECPGHELLELLWPPNNPSFGTDGIHTLGMERDFLMLMLEYLRLCADELQGPLFTYRTLHLPGPTRWTKMLFPDERAPDKRTWLFHWSARWRPTRPTESWGFRFGRSGIALVVEQPLAPISGAVRPSVTTPYDTYLPPELLDTPGPQPWLLDAQPETQPQPDPAAEQQSHQEPKQSPPPSPFSIGLPTTTTTTTPTPTPTLNRASALSDWLALRDLLRAEIGARSRNEANLAAAALLARRVYDLSLDRADPMWRVVADLGEAAARERAALAVARRNLVAVERGAGAGCWGVPVMGPGTGRGSSGSGGSRAGDGDAKEVDGVSGNGNGDGNGNGGDGDGSENRRWKGKEKETDLGGGGQSQQNADDESQDEKRGERAGAHHEARPDRDQNHDQNDKEDENGEDEVCIWTSRPDFVAACNAEWIRWRAVGGPTRVVPVRLPGEEKPVLAVRWRLSG